MLNYGGYRHRPGMGWDQNWSNLHFTITVFKQTEIGLV